MNSPSAPPCPVARQTLSALAIAMLAVLGVTHCRAEEPSPTRELRDLNKSYFPFTPVKDKAAWDTRRAEVQKRVAET